MTGDATTAHPAERPAVLAARLPDVRAVPLDALRNRALIGADDLPQPEARVPVPTAAFNASL